MRDIDIRPAEVSDAALILRFIKELAIYERAEHEVVATETDIENSLLDEGSPARAVICSVDGVHAGLAVHFFNCSTWQGRKGLYPEDLYVSPVHRDLGAGKAFDLAPVFHTPRQQWRTSQRSKILAPRAKAGNNLP